MHHIGFILLTILACAPATALGQESVSTPPAVAAQSLGKPFVYKHVDGRDLTLWVTEPRDVGSTDASPLRSAIVLFHGGGWTGGRPGQLLPQAQAVAQHGGVAVLVQYRFVPDHSYEPQACVEDTKSAMRWVRSHAKELHLDPNRIAIGGASAGGYNAAYATMAPGWDAHGDDLSVSPTGNAMVLWNPVIDTSAKGYAHASFGDEDVERSPMTYLSAKTPPMLIQSGTEDVHIHADVLQAFAAKAQSLGVRCDLITYKGQPHGFFNKEPFLTQTTGATVKFLASLGYIRP